MLGLLIALLLDILSTTVLYGFNEGLFGVLFLSLFLFPLFVLLRLDLSPIGISMFFSC